MCYSFGVEIRKTMPKGNRQPRITPEFENQQFKPIAPLPDEPLAKQPLAVRVGQSVDEKIRRLPQSDRIIFLRNAITEAAKKLQ